MAKSPKRIRVRDGDALLEHAKVLQLRSQSHDLIDQELRPAEQRVEEARLRLREAKVAAEQVKLALKAIGLEERKAIERFFALVRKGTPQMRVMAERYGGDVSFNFDSNGRSVWVMALFGNGAPLALSAVVHKYGDVFSGRIEFRSPPSILRDGATPPRLLRMNGRGWCDSNTYL